MSSRRTTRILLERSLIRKQADLETFTQAPMAVQSSCTGNQALHMPRAHPSLIPMAPYLRRHFRRRFLVLPLELYLTLRSTPYF